MEIIRESDIDFSSLCKLDSKVNNESRLFYDEDTMYKMYKRLSYMELRRKQRKVELLSDGDVLKDAVIPRDEIVKGYLLSGITMERIKNALPLFEFAKRSNSINKYLELVYRVSLSLREIHNDPRNIVVGDVSFSNIIFDDKFRHYFVDFDSCMIDGIPADRICFILSDYINKRNLQRMDINQDSDRLSLMLCTLYTIFLRGIDEVPMYEYDLVAEKVEALRNMREFVVEMKKHGRFIPSVPYIDEVIPVPSRKRIKGTIRERSDK